MYVCVCMYEIVLMLSDYNHLYMYTFHRQIKR